MCVMCVLGGGGGEGVQNAFFFLPRKTVDILSFVKVYFSLSYMKCGLLYIC